MLLCYTARHSITPVVFAVPMGTAELDLLDRHVVVSLYSDSAYVQSSS